VYSINNISVSYSGTPVFEDASFLINQKDRIGLVGKNGSGKTTLLRIISGAQKAEAGEVVIPADAMVGYLPQEMVLKNNKTVKEEAAVAFREIQGMKVAIGKLSDEITRRTDYHSADYERIVTKLADLNDRFQLLGGQNIEGDTEKVLSGLGFVKSDLDRPLNEFSYGWQMRVEIAKILLRKPDLILLDEPTNHLDIESIQWLEQFLINYHGAVVLVSHDRAFLDNITNRTIEIDRGRIYDYKASYTAYVELREQRLEKQIAAYNNQQRQIRQVERFIERFRYKNTKASQVQSRIKMLEKMEKVDIDDFDLSSIHFQFPPAPPSGKVVVSAADLYKSYDSTKVLEGLDFSIIKGERVAFVGRNGEGKTTLAKIITGSLDHTGTCRLGYNVSLGYFAQNQNEMLDPELTVFETIDHIAKGEIRKKIRTILGGFLFDEEDIDKKVKVLSGGEKTRLALAKLLLEPVNLLVLDEPTNHLDMRSKDILKNALLLYNGTLIIVSHDRDFLQGLTDKVFEFRNRRIKEYIGDVYDFLQNRKIDHLDDLNAGFTRQGKETDEKPDSDQKIIYLKRKEIDRDIRKTRSRIEAIEQKIERLEEELSKMNRILSNPSENPEENIETEIFERYGSVKNEIAGEMEEWESLQIELESLAEQKEMMKDG
jgi:ATP-binding cassette subfamily F protein 3